MFLASWREDARKNPKSIVAMLLGIMSGLLIFFAGLLISAFAPAIEMELKWNEIRDIQRLDTVGQLVPFCLSVGMLLHVVYSIFRQKDGFGDDEGASGELAAGERQIVKCSANSRTGPPPSQCPKKAKGCAEQNELLASDTSRSGFETSDV